MLFRSRLTRDGWDRYSEVHQDHLIAGAAALRRDAALPLDGSTKDGAHGVQGQYRVVDV